MTEAAAAVGGDARVEPVFAPQTGDPPVVTDEVSTGRASVVRRATGALLALRALLARSFGVVRRINLVALALVVLGMGLAVFAMGLVLYFSSRSSPAVGPERAFPADGAASVVQAPLPSLVALGPQASEPASKVPAAVKEVTPPLESAPASEAGASAASASAAPEPPASAAQASVEGAFGPAQALPPALPAANEPEPQADTTYGVDANVNGVPDVLDRWLTRTLQSPVTQEAGRQYYRAVLPLATKLHLGVALSNAEKLTALRAAECYLITATEEGLRVPPNLNDRVLIQGGEAAERMKGLFKELQGVNFPVSANRRGACT